ncbi:MAG: hypothetical protein LKE52_05185 [Bacilli bacterium]|jgi:hypothetical protein|nr:hypothetical protein [Bacilli bacterium]
MNNKAYGKAVLWISGLTGSLFLALSILLFTVKVQGEKEIGAAVAFATFAAILLASFFYLLIQIVIRKKVPPFPDERQLKMRLIGVSLSFFLLIVYMTVIEVLNTLASISFGSGLIEFLIGLEGVCLVGILFEVFTDSFLLVGQETNMDYMAIIYMALGITNLSLGISSSDVVTSSGVLGDGAMYYATAIFNILIGLAVLTKISMNKKT